MKPFVPSVDALIKSTRISFLPFLAGIESLENRRLYACEKFLRRANNEDHPLHQMMYCSHKLTRLRSRHPLRNLDLTVSVADHSVPEDLAEFIPHWSKEPFLVANFHASDESSSTDYATDLDDSPTTCIAGAFPKRVHVNVVQKSKPTPTSYRSAPFGNHRVTLLK